ncbi:MAG: hypothetical protein HC838_01050 [Spirulinaceae cyanobacterium RM2_2_10]|nr:hypothetical protein [Spirulinaceae cyanobacterium RM2_2_10]
MGGNSQTAPGAAPVAGAPQNGEVNSAALENQEQGYADVLEREPDNLTALEGLARTRIELGKLEAALDPLQKLSKQDPENQGVLQAIAAIQIQRQDFAAALEPLNRWIELDPENEEIQQLRTQLEQYLESGATKSSPSPAPTDSSGIAPEASPESGTDPDPATSAEE